MLGVESKFFDCIPCRFKQGIIYHSWFNYGKTIERIWQSEDDMKIRNWQQFFLSLFYPFLSLLSLAFRTMSIAATIITYAHHSTFCACIYMAANADVLHFLMALRVRSCHVLSLAEPTALSTSDQCCFKTSDTSNAACTFSPYYIKYLVD